MGSRGPQPSPRSASTARGKNTGSAKLPTVATTAPPECPDNLPEAGKELWRKFAEELHHAGLLTERDVPAFSRLCHLWAQLKELDLLIERDGVVLDGPTGLKKANPAVSMRAACDRQFLQHCQQFSLTPGARLRIPDSDPPKPPRMRRDRLAEMRRAGADLSDDEMENLIFGDE